ncbi:hypothetical protein [Parabacteroides johnsonii]|jgi:hypothetical protein|uniref:OmpR/PhoB-type domain-containing protein n=1 Tax=Parabacteroides johnsonii CL02T12C29 TaxID=999419 RepID=K6A6A0_9BACT|nr:hypothetical protein HMPREF1077_01466 [Parabacteroides johnsonii CL02T12C29]
MGKRIKERFEANPDVEVEEEIYHFGNTVFDYSTNEIRTGNSKILVTFRQAEILRILVRNPNVVIDREIILS